MSGFLLFRAQYNVNVYYRKEDEKKLEIAAFLDYCSAYWQKNYA